MSSEARNLELKARDPDPPRSLAVALGLPGATDEGELWQRDTYFGAAAGRLKLREQSPGEAHLIGYVRADEAVERISSYRIAAVPDAAALAEVLDASLGTRVVVTKRRRLVLWENVRVHLDAVEELGTFVELEAVLRTAQDERESPARVTRLRDALAIADERVEPRGYADLLLGK